jgi:HNH endonuclease
MRIGELVRSHIGKIQRYCESYPEELSHLMDAAYSRKIFKLNWPFFGEIDRISPINNVRYWRDRYVIGNKQLRACSQWYEKDREAFNRYLRSKGIGNGEPGGHPNTADSPPQSRNNRYKATAIADAQNLFIRVILSKIGDESFSQKHWDGAKIFFNGNCAYCGEAKELYMDHGVPINKTTLGEHRLGNLIPSCKKCNDDKHYADFKVFLGDRIDRIAKIEAYMTNRDYTPLGDNTQIKMILDQAHAEVAALAQRYIDIINVVLASGPCAAKAGALPG